MNQVFKITVLSLFVLLSSQLGMAQKNKKGRKGKKNCPTYTEDVRTSLPQYEMPNFDADTSGLGGSLEVVVLKDDSLKADSVQRVLKRYFKDKTKTAGWRIQVWTGQSERNMNGVTARYREAYEDLDLYVHEDWDETFFRVKIGDFTDRLEAYKALMKIKEEFLTALLVPDQVDLDKI